MTVRVRIAPSPTGDPHVGTAYMALFNLIFARHYKGQFILRIEDTDQSRSQAEYEENIYHALRWCGIDWDEGPDCGGEYGPYRQSERFDIYQKYAQELLEKNKAYKCFATSEELAQMRKEGTGYDRRYRDLDPKSVAKLEEEGRPFVLRLKVPLEGECIFEDQIKGSIRFPWADVDDQILLKSDGFPTYHLASVVDDFLMGITHVIRGDEWLSSTPKHVFLYEAFGWTPPFFLHMPLLLNSERKKLSKRKNPTSVFFYRDNGYLPQAFSNFLSLMGYSMPNDKEIYSIEEIIEAFDPSRIGISGAIFDLQKLKWLNQQYLIDQIPQGNLWQEIRDWGFNDEKMQKIMPLCHERMKTFGDFIQLCDFFFVSDLVYREDLFQPKGIEVKTATWVFQAILWTLDSKINWLAEDVAKASFEVAEKLQLHHKKVIMPLLFAAIMAKENGPSLFKSVEILGKEKSRARFLQAIEFLGGISKKSLSSLRKEWEAPSEVKTS